MLCVFALLCVLSLLLYIVVPLLLLPKFTGYCHLVETQVALDQYHIIYHSNERITCVAVAVYLQV